MENTQSTRLTLDETMAKLGRTIRNAPEEKQEGIKTFLEGFLAGLEYQRDQKAAG